MKGVRVSAPAKVILHGEHAVVYGKTAIAISVDLRTSLTVKHSLDHVSLFMPDLNCRYCWRLEELQSLRSQMVGLDSWRVRRDSWNQPTSASSETLETIRQFLAKEECENNPDNGVVAFLYLYLKIFPACTPLSTEISSQIPIGAGLGSSAAMSVCFASGLLLFCRNLQQRAKMANGNGFTNHVIDRANGNGVLPVKNGNGVSYQNGNAFSHVTTNGNHLGDSDGMEDHDSSEDEASMEMGAEERNLICQWAFMAEKVMHGTPSGIDNSVATYGGVVTYCSGVMTPLADLAGLEILLTNTRVGRNTKHLVQGVKERLESFPKVVEPIMDAVEKVSLMALTTLQACRVKQFTDCKQEFSKLETLVDMNQCLLASLGVSHPSLEQVVNIGSAQGLHTKLTGAGGGGVAFSLITPTTSRENVDQAKCDLEEAGFLCYTAAIGGPGVLAYRL